MDNYALFAATGGFSGGATPSKIPLTDTSGASGITGALNPPPPRTPIDWRL